MACADNATIPAKLAGVRPAFEQAMTQPIHLKAKGGEEPGR
jgi:hypothetical protein